MTILFAPSPFENEGGVLVCGWKTDRLGKMPWFQSSLQHLTVNWGNKYCLLPFPDIAGGDSVNTVQRNLFSVFNTEICQKTQSKTATFSYI